MYIYIYYTIRTNRILEIVNEIKQIRVPLSLFLSHAENNCHGKTSQGTISFDPVDEFHATSISSEWKLA